jgi:hypothetical protein
METVTDLIQQLQDIVKEHGNIQILLENADGIMDIGYVTVRLIAFDGVTKKKVALIV